MGEMFERKSLVSQNSTAMETAIQYTVWAWRQSPLFEEACAVYKEDGEDALVEYIGKQDAFLRYLYKKDHPNEEPQFEVPLKFDAKDCTNEYLAKWWYTVVQDATTETKIELNYAVRKAIEDSVEREESGEKPNLRTHGAVETIDLMDCETLLEMPAYYMIKENISRFMIVAGDKFPSKSGYTADDLYPSCAEKWEEIKNTMGQIKDARIRGGVFFCTLLLGAAIVGLAQLIISLLGEWTTCILLITVLIVITIAMGKYVVTAVMSAVYVLAERLWHISDYVLLFFVGIGVLLAILAVYNFFTTPNKKKSNEMAEKAKPRLQALQRYYGERYAHLQRYLHSISPEVKNAFSKTIDAYEEAIRVTEERMAEIDNYVIECYPRK